MLMETHHRQLQTTRTRGSATSKGHHSSGNACLRQDTRAVFLEIVNKNIREVTLSSPINGQFKRLTYVGKANCAAAAKVSVFEQHL